MDMYEDVDPYEGLSPDLRRIMERRSAEEVQAGEALCRIRTEQIQQQRETLDEHLTARHRESSENYYTPGSL
jgi:hypothetical protein